MVRYFDKFLTRLEEALQTMPDIADITISADYTGAALTGQLPRSVQAYRFNGDVDVTDDATWSFDLNGDTLTATIADGELEITAIEANSVVTITSDYGGVERSRTFSVILDIAEPPEGAGTDTSQDTSLDSFNSTSYAPVSREITVTVGASGNVNLAAAYLSVYSDFDGTAGPWNVYGKWEWWDGAAWVIVGAEQQSHPDHEYPAGPASIIYGTLNVSRTKTGLVAAASEKFRLSCKNASGTRVMYLDGKAVVSSS